MLEPLNPARVEPVVASALAAMWPVPYAATRLAWRGVQLSDVRSLVHVARRQRLESAEELLEHYRAALLTPFLPLRRTGAVVSPSRRPPPRAGSGRAREESSIIVPPVAEQHDELFVLLDGVHRSMAAYRSGLRTIHLFSVHGSLPTPAGDVCTLPEIGLSSEHRAPEVVFRNLRKEDFRPVGAGGRLEAAVRREMNRRPDRRI